MFHHISRIFVLLFGAGYPAYMTYKATKQRDLKEHHKWLTYWIVYATFISLEPFLDILAYIVPFYYTIKMAFLYWLVALGGSTIVYQAAILPILSSKEKDIDAQINKIRSEHLEGIVQVAQDLLAKGISLVNSTTAKAKSGGPEQNLEGLNENNNPVKR